MTVMLGCRPILSPGVARRQEHPHSTSVFWEMMGAMHELCISVSYYQLSNSVIIWVNTKAAVKMDSTPDHLLN